MASYHETDRLSSSDHLDLLVEQQRSYTRMLAPLGMNLPTRDQCEAILHHDAEIGAWATGDVSAWPPEKWCSWVDDWHWAPTEPTPIEAKVEEEPFALALLEEAAEIEAVLAEFEAENLNEEDRADFEAWLDSLEPTYGELENRDLTDCGFGLCD